MRGFTVFVLHSSAAAEADPPFSIALPNIQPHELCLITDHEPVARNMCETLFKDVEATLHRSGEREGALEEATSTVEGFKSVGLDFTIAKCEVVPAMGAASQAQVSRFFVEAVR